MFYCVQSEIFFYFLLEDAFSPKYKCMPKLVSFQERWGQPKGHSLAERKTIQVPKSMTVTSQYLFHSESSNFECKRERGERETETARERELKKRQGGEGSACFPSPRLPPVLRHALVKINQTNAEEQTWTTSNWPCWEVQELENLVSFCVEKGFMYSIVTI